jgi:ribosomal protein S18 acetylase RimI-like enzyme
MVRRWMAVSDAILLVAERNGQIMGMTLAVASRMVDEAGLVTPGHPVIPGLCHISLVFVVPDAWGRGIGAQLLDAVLAEIRRREYAHVQLWTHEDNVRARRLYVSRGFRLTDDRRANPAGETIVRFERPAWVGDDPVENGERAAEPRS